MKIFALIIFLFAFATGYAQSKIAPTDSFVVKGQIKNSVTFSINMLDTFKAKSLNDIITVNHLGQALTTIKNVRGVLLKDVLSDIQLKSRGPKQSFSYYMECVASDGFKVVFSRNEIFNTMNGDNTFIIVERDGEKLKDIDDRIAILMLTGNGKGHIYIKGLQQIIIKSVNEE